jgi:hypothetical protein
MIERCEIKYGTAQATDENPEVLVLTSVGGIIIVNRLCRDIIALLFIRSNTIQHNPENLGKYPFYAHKSSIRPKIRDDKIKKSAMISRSQIRHRI